MDNREPFLTDFLLGAVATADCNATGSDAANALADQIAALWAALADVDRVRLRDQAAAALRDEASIDRLANSLDDRDGDLRSDDRDALPDSNQRARVTSLLHSLADSTLDATGHSSASRLHAHSLLSTVASRGAPTLADERADLPDVAGYRPLRRLGQGAFGTVYLARHASGGACALKLGKLTSPEQAERLAREVDAMRRFDHPHLVRYLDSGTQQGWFFVAMEYGGALTLADLLAHSRPAQGNPIPPTRRLNLTSRPC